MRKVNMKGRKRIVALAILFFMTILISAIFILNRGKTVNLLIVGDSIGEGAGATVPANKWYKYLISYMKEEHNVNLKVTNVSLGGNSSFAGYAQVMRLDNKEDYDWVIVCYGQNDQEEDFAFYYESLLRSIYWKYPNSQLMTILESSQKTYTEKIKTIQQLSEHYDAIEAFEQSGYTYEELCDDGTHPNDLGQRVYFDVVKDTLNNILSEKRESSEYVEALNPEVDKMQQFTYYKLSQFQEQGNLTYQIEVDNPGDIWGMDYDIISGNNSISISFDDEFITQKEISWENKFQLQYIEVFLKNYANPTVIKISFSSEEQKQAFHGIIVSG